MLNKIMSLTIAIILMFSMIAFAETEEVELNEFVEYETAEQEFVQQDYDDSEFVHFIGGKEESDAEDGTSGEIAPMMAGIAPMAGNVSQSGSFINPNASLYYSSNPTGYTPGDGASIDPINGNLIVRATDVSLKGRNGLDLNLSRYYNSSMATLKTPEAQVTYTYESTDRYTPPIITKTGVEGFVDSTSAKYSNIGIGWFFDIPYIENNYLHLGSSGTYYFYVGGHHEKCFEHCSEYTIAGYFNQDLQLNSSDKEFDEGTAKYVLNEKDGKKHYFAESGKLLVTVDRFDNIIKYFYDVNEKGFNRLIKIIDSVGREVSISYPKKATEKNITITVVDKNDSNNNKTVTYNTNDTGNLHSVQNAEGLITAYTYNKEQFYVSLLDRIPDDKESNEYKEKLSDYYMMSRITSPTGGYAGFKFSDRKNESDINFYTEFKLYTGKYDNDGIKNHNETTEETKVEKGIKKHTKTYHRDGDDHVIVTTYQNKDFSTNNAFWVEGYTFEGYVCDGHFSPEWGIYQCTSTNYCDNLAFKKTVISPFEIPECTSMNKDVITDIEYRVGDKVYEKIQYQYIQNTHTDESGNILYANPHSPSMVVRSVADPTVPIDPDTDIQPTIQDLTTSVNYTYNAYGDVLSKSVYEGNAGLEPSDPKLKERFTNTYTYHDNYHYLTYSKEYRNESDFIETIHTPKVDDRFISSVEIRENSIPQAITVFDYDNYGNVKWYDNYKEYKNNVWTRDVIRYNIEYNDNSGRENPIVGVYPSRIYVEGIKGADGMLIPARSANSGDAGRIEQTFTYDYFGNLTSETDGNGNVYSYTYDKLNRLETVRSPERQDTELASKSFKYTVSSTENSVQITDEQGAVYEKFYSKLGLLTKETIPDNITFAEYDYYPSGSLKTKTSYMDDDTKKIITEYQYDARLRQTQISTYDNSIDEKNLAYQEVYEYSDEVVAYTGYQTVTKTIFGGNDTSSIVTKSYTDKFGDVCRIERLNGTEKPYKEEYSYDFMGNLWTVNEARTFTEPALYNAPSKRYEYTFDNQVKKEYNVNEDFIENNYDALGRLTSVTDYNKNTKYFEYDDASRLIVERTPVEGNYFSTTKYYYDRNGNITTQSTSNNVPGEAESFALVSSKYNWRNQPTLVNNEGEYTQYAYDVSGNMIRMYNGQKSPLSDNISTADISAFNAKYAVTKYTYNKLNQLTTMTDPVGRVESYSYYRNGSVHTKTDKNKNTTTFTYDAMNRLTNRTDGTDSYSYDYYLTGNRKSMMTNGVSTTDYRYDTLGRLWQEIDYTGTDEIEKIYGYDANNNRTSFEMSTTSGSATVSNIKLTYAYYNTNQLHTVTEGGRVTTYEYDTNGNLKAESNPQVATSYSHNSANMLTSMTNKNNKSENISAYAYKYRLDGNMYEKVENGITTEYTYYQQGRLKDEFLNGTPVNSFTYDLFGNRTTKTSGETITTYGYDLSNRLHTETAKTGPVEDITSYFYDDNGNMTCKMSSSISPSEGLESLGISAGESGDIGFERYEYDGFNQLSAVHNKNGTASYTYNADGLRLSKNVNGTVTDHYWDGANMVMESTDSLTTTYTRGLSLISRTRKGTQEWYTHNGQGDVTGLLMLMNTGKLVATKDYSYDAFGNEIDVQSNNIIQMPELYVNDRNPFRYRGEYYDNETGSIYLRARVYAPGLGRFTSEDPIRDGLNWYAYCGGNPVMFRDPSGLSQFAEPGSAEEYNEWKAGAYVQNCDSPVFDYEWVDYLVSSGNMPQGYSSKMSVFFLTIPNFRHGLTFESHMESVEFFYRLVSAFSIKTDWEIGTYFYSKKEDGKIIYSFTQPHTSYLSKNVAFAGDSNNPDMKVPIPSDAKFLGIGHTHGAWRAALVGRDTGTDYNDVFSDGDKHISKKHNVPMYLVSPNGALQVYQLENVGLGLKTYNYLSSEIYEPWTFAHNANHPKLPDGHSCSNCI